MVTQKEAIGKRIKKARIHKKYQLSKVAEKIGVSKSFLSSIESGKTYLSIHQLKNLCSILNVKADYIIFGDFYYNVKPLIDKAPPQTIDEMKKIITQLLKEKYE